MADCGSLLRSLTKEVDTALYLTCKCSKLYTHLRVTTDLLQGKAETPCQFLIQLQAPKAASLPTLKQTVAKVAEAISQLASKNIIVCIGLDAGRTGALPSPSFLNKLAPILDRLDCLTSLRLTNRHIRALLPSTSRISSLSVSRHRLCTSGYHQHDFSLHSLSSFTNLQQLELHLDTGEGLPHLLALKGLLEFHLTVRRHDWSDSNCSNILNSSKDSLRHVSLTAQSWDDRTYWALPHLSSLRTFSLQVEQLRHGNAQVLTQLRPSQSMSVTINNADLLSRMVMQEVTSFEANITDLTLYEVCPFARTMHLRTMQHLTSLTLVGLDLTRTHFQPQPRLRTLTLSGVCMGSTHCEQVVQSYPSLKQLTLQRLQISPHSLSICCCCGVSPHST